MAPQKITAFMPQGREPRYVFRQDLITFPFKLVEGGLHINRIPQDKGIDNKAERAELFFLALTVTLAQLALFAVVHFPCKAVPPFAPVKLGEDAPAVIFIIDVVQHINRFRNFTEFGDGRAQSGRALAVEQ